MSDIRKFFGGGAKPKPAAPKPAEPASSPAAAAKKQHSVGAADEAPPSAKRSKYFAAAGSGPAPKASDGSAPSGSVPSKAATPKAAPAKRKKAAVIESDSESDVAIGSSSDESVSDADDAGFIVDSSADDSPVKPSAKKKAKTGDAGVAKPASAAKGKAATPTAQATTGSKAATPIGAAKLTAAAAKKAARPQMVIEPSKPAVKHEVKPGSSNVVVPVAAAPKKAKAAPAAALDATAQAAIAAVEKKAKELPGLEVLQESGKVSFMAPGTDFTVQNSNAPPPNAGSKTIPRGHPDAFTNKTFVITGVLDSLTRQDAEDLVKRHGGKVTQAVSGRTRFLVAGNLGGSSKARGAKDYGTQVIDEDGLLALVAATSDLAPADDAAPSQPLLSQAAALQPGGASQPSGAAVRPSSGAVAGSQPPGSQQGAAAARPSGGAWAGPSSQHAGGSQQPAAAPPAGGRGTQLWVDKYKPRGSGELVGNQTAIQTLRQWLTGWEAVHLRGGDAGSTGGARAKDLNKKAVLLSGPPGIGKTSAAHIVARECGYAVIEANASDTRNKADAKASMGVGGKASNMIKEMTTNTSVAAMLAPPNGGAGAGARGTQKQLLVMDEVDGMSAGDRGGVADLIQTIHKSRVPIICICNDKYSQKLRSLRNHCLELEFRKPTPASVASRLQAICTAEGLKLNQATLDALVQGANGDIRLILGQLQMIRLRSASLTYDQVKSGALGSSKDMDMSPFTCARDLLEASSKAKKLAERAELVFQDADLVPLLLQENYLNHRPAIAVNAPNFDAVRLKSLAKAADCFSAGDTVNSRVRRYQAWGLLPAAVMTGSVMPAAYAAGNREPFGLFPGEQNFPRFTAWLGNFSSSNKQRRLLGELTTNMLASGHVSGHTAAVRLDYVSALRHLLTAPLAKKQDEGIPEVVSRMQTYCINREQFDYVLDVTKFKSKAGWAEDPMKEVPTKVKSAFTRTFNQQGLVPRTNTMVEDAKAVRGKGKGKRGSAAAGPDDDGIDGEELAALEEQPAEEEEEEQDPEALRQSLANQGIKFERKEAPSGKKSGGGAKSGGGRGSGAGRGGGRSGAASGRGSGRGKK